MSSVGFIVKALQSENAAEFEWCLSGFPTMYVRIEWKLKSPVFSFLGIKWRLYFRKIDITSGYTRVSIMPLKYTTNSQFPIHVCYWLGVLWMDGVQEKIGSGSVMHEYRPNYEHQPPREYWSSHSYFWLPVQELQSRMENLAPSGTLKFIIRLRTENEMSSLNMVKESTSSTEARIQTGLDDTHFLIEHYRHLLLHADDHDVVIKVKGKEFKAHKSMLRVRSPVFQGMFKHNMKENMEDTVIIEDMDPDCFGDFLMYVYTGKVENLSATNAIGLYYAGDKYDFPALKTRCVDVLKASLSNSIVCDIITMAIDHEEEELLESGMAYVTCHLEELMETPKWQQFLLSNPLQANEISLKALKRRRTSSLQK